MKKIPVFLALIYFGFVTILSAQNDPLQKWSASEISRANTAKDVSYLTKEEQKVIFYCNLARIDGAKFGETFVKKHVAGQRSSYISSLYRDLKKIKGLTPLVSYKKLHESAKYHAKDMGEKGKIGHSSSNGTSFADRVRSYAEGGYIAENCSYGSGDAIGIVMQLLIDDGVPSLGHRKNILSENYKSIGVSIAEHKQWRYNCVQDFSDYIPAE